MGVWSAVAGAGGATGALLGGILTQELSWRWILFINIPIGIVTMVAGRAYLQESRVTGEHRPTLDVPGAVLVTSGLTALVLGVVRTTTVGWGSWQTLTTLGISAALITVFLYYEARVAKAPLMPLRMFERRSIWTSNLTMFLLSGAIFAMWFFVSLYLQQVRGYSPMRTGFAFVPQTIAIIIGAQVSSRLVVRFGPRPLLVIGALCSAGGLFWLGGVGVTTAYWSGFFVPSVLVTLGLGLCFTPLAFAATAGVPPQEAAERSGWLRSPPSRLLACSTWSAASVRWRLRPRDIPRRSGSLLSLPWPQLARRWWCRRWCGSRRWALTRALGLSGPPEKRSPIPTPPPRPRTGPRWLSR